MPDGKRRADRQEKHIAKKYGFRQTAGSGISSRDKSDAVGSMVRVEAKSRSLDSFPIKKAVLDKIKREAGALVPVLHFEFSQHRSLYTYLVLPLAIVNLEGYGETKTFTGKKQVTFKLSDGFLGKNYALIEWEDGDRHVILHEEFMPDEFNDALS